MTSCPGSLFAQVVMDRHTCLVQSYLECASHALGSSVTNNIFRAQTGMRVRGHTSFSVLSSSKGVGRICLSLKPGRENPDPEWAVSWCGRPSCETFAWTSAANEFCRTMCKVRQLDCLELVYHSSVFMSKRRLFGKYGELCISSMLQDAFGDLILVPNSKTTERLPEKLAERRGKRLAATAFVF